MEDKYCYIQPTHRCSICGAYWKEWRDSWSMVSDKCEHCCDNVAMGQQIIKLVIYDEKDQKVDVNSSSFTTPDHELSEVLTELKQAEADNKILQEEVEKLKEALEDIICERSQCTCHIIAEQVLKENN